MTSCFSQDGVTLKDSAKYVLLQSHREREHAETLRKPQHTEEVGSSSWISRIQSHLEKSESATTGTAQPATDKGDPIM